MYSRGEYYRFEHYRCLALAAKQRAAQSSDPRLKDAFKDVARHWLALAETSCVAREAVQQQASQPMTEQHKTPEEYRQLAV
jgi:hypothetical protein